ncbi:MAG: hypothetical protein ABSC05_21475 [Candidatus Solibacter sp.]|jgi:predicted deacylase
MLRPFAVRAAASGPVRYRLKLGDYVNPGTLVAHVGDGEALAELSADQSHVWEALRALYVVGQAEDLEDVRRFLRPLPGLPEKMARQAALTAQAIQARGKP